MIKINIIVKKGKDGVISTKADYDFSKNTTTEEITQVDIQLTEMKNLLKQI